MRPSSPRTAAAIRKSSVRARELDQRELELSARASDLTARLEQMPRAILGNATRDALAQVANIERREAELMAREAEFTVRRPRYAALEEAQKPEVNELAEHHLKQRERRAQQGGRAEAGNPRLAEQGLDEREKVLAARAKELERDAAAEPPGGTARGRVRGPRAAARAAREGRCRARGQRPTVRATSPCTSHSSRRTSISRDPEWWTKQLGNNAGQSPAA